MTSEQIALVQRTFSLLNSRFGLFVDLFYFRLFALAPDTRELFSSDMRLQKHALASMLQTMVADLHWDEELVPLVTQLGARHARYGVRDGDYETVGIALTWALEQTLDDDFPPEAHDAWRAAYWKFASIMRTAQATQGRASRVARD